MKQKLEPLFLKFQIFKNNQLLTDKVTIIIYNYFYYIKVITSRQTRIMDKDDL